MFALPWYLTWFGHSLNRYKDVVRLYDFFLATPPLMPVYVASALVLDRSNEIFQQDCDLASIHCLLSQIPNDIDFERILKNALLYYKKHEPTDVEKDVIKRVKREYVLFGFVHFLRKLYYHFLKIVYLSKLFPCFAAKKKLIKINKQL